MFFYFCKVLFSDFLQFNGNFVDAQNNSEYRDWAPLMSYFKKIATSLQEVTSVLHYPSWPMSNICAKKPIATISLSKDNYLQESW